LPAPLSAGSRGHDGAQRARLTVPSRKDLLIATLRGSVEGSDQGFDGALWRPRAGCCPIMEIDPVAPYGLHLSSPKKVLVFLDVFEQRLKAPVAATADY
jgi:hypothetical protein